MGDKGACWGEEGPGAMAVGWEPRAAPLRGAGAAGPSVWGITIAAWFLGLEFTAVLPRLGTPFCLSAGAEGKR